MSVPRRLLLIALVLGIAGMHTLGHPASAHGHDGVIVASSEHSWSGPMAASPHDGDHHAVRQAAPDKSFPKLDPLTVCLAIMASLALLVLARYASRARPAAMAGPSAPGGRGMSIARPPPKRTAVRLAFLSVLRI